MEEHLDDAGQRPIDVLCEEERWNRLAERMRRDPTEGGELARERRAHLVAREVRTSGFSRSPTRGLDTAPSQSGGAAASIAAASASRSAAAVSSPSVTQRRTLNDLSGAPPSEVLAGLKKELDKVEKALSRQEKEIDVHSTKVAQAAVPAKPVMAEEELEDAAEPLRATSSLVAVESHATSSAVSLADRLNAALDEITVKGILDLRSIPEGKAPDAVVGIVLAAFHLLGGVDQTETKMPLEPVKTWAEARQLLLKPGHFVNALRRFSYAADRGQVPEVDLSEAEDRLAEVLEDGQELAKLHPTAAQLYEWTRAAVDYASRGRSRLEDVASPARAVRAPPRPPAAPATESATPPRPAPAPAAPATEASATPARPAPPPAAPATASSASSTAQAMKMQEKESAFKEMLARHERMMMEVERPPLRESPAPPAASTPVRPPAQVPVSTASTPPAARNSGGGAGLSMAWSALAMEEETPAPQGQAVSRGPPSTPVRLDAGAQGEFSPPLSQPARSPASSPRPSRLPAPPQSPRGSPLTRTSSAKSSLTPQSAPLQSSSGSRSKIPAPSPRRAAAGATSPRRNAPQGSPMHMRPRTNGTPQGSPMRPRPGSAASSKALVQSRSSASTPALLPQTEQTPTLLTSTLPTGQLPQGEVEAYKKQLEQTKKEVREIRSLEAQLRWGMHREERRQVVEEKKEAEQEIREWREEQSLLMKESEKERKEEQRAKELVESKDFHTFKREVKKVEKEEEILQIQEQYQADLIYAREQAELKRRVEAERHVLVAEQKANMEEVRVIKANEEFQQKVEEEEDRIHDVRLEMEHQANQISAQKEELLRNLHFMRSTKQRLPPGARMGQASGSASQLPRPRSVRAGR